MAADGKHPETGPERDEDRVGDATSPAASRTDGGVATTGDSDDRDDPASTEPPFSIAFGEGTPRVDRDDDGDSDSDGTSPVPFVDSDYAADFPGVPGAVDEDETGPDDPGPAYAALYDELDDPLADWPAPDADLTSLPEVRDRVAVGEAYAPPQQDDPFARDSRSAGAATSPGSGRPGDRLSGPLADDLREAAFFDDPVEPDPLHDYAGMPQRESGAATPVVDRDEPAAIPGTDSGPAAGDIGKGVATDADADRPSVSAAPLPAAQLPATEPPATELLDPPNFEDVDESDYADVDPLPPVPDDPFTAGDTKGGAVPDIDADDEAFIDDFLNDLDEPDEADPDEATTMQRRNSSSAPIGEADDTGGSVRGGDSTVGASVARYGADVLDADDNQQADTQATADGRQRKLSADTDDESQGLPWGMIAVVAIALLLLAGGGFGVVQQRSTLKAEIRDLQAQLATAVAPEEAAAERERQRQIELKNESLAAEVAALEAENGALSDQLESLEAKLEEQLAAQESAAREVQAAAEAAASAAQSAAREAAAPVSGAAAVADVSGWFVNFGSYAQESIARRWADRLEVSNGSVIVQEARASGRTLYRVRVVGLATQDAAERVATTLERQHQLPRLWVGRN